MLDLNAELSIAKTVPAAAYTATTNGATVDLQGFDGAVVVFEIGVVTADDLTFTIQEADDDGAGSPDTWAAVAAAELDGTVPTPTTTADETVAQVGYLGNARFLRVVVTDGGTGDGLLAAHVVRGKRRKLS